MANEGSQTVSVDKPDTFLQRVLLVLVQTRAQEIPSINQGE